MRKPGYQLNRPGLLALLALVASLLLTATVPVSPASAEMGSAPGFRTAGESLAVAAEASPSESRTGENPGIPRWLILLLVLAGLAGFLEIAWIFVPFFFHILASPKLDGTYRYAKGDFLPDGRTPSKPGLSRQNSDYRFEFDGSLPEYRIRFGDNRALTMGRIRVMSQGTWHSSSPEQGERRIRFLSLTETTDRGGDFQGMEGDFKRISVAWEMEGESVPLTTHFDLYRNCSIRAREPDLRENEVLIRGLNFLVFSVSFPAGLENCSTGAFESLCVNFPCFQNDSPNRRMLTFQEAILAPPSRDAAVTSAPRLFFDEDGHTFLVCALDEFTIHLTSLSGPRIACGLNGEIERIEPAYASRYLLLFGSGINRTFERFGDLLRCWHGKSRKSMYRDVATRSLGYWTDNGAHYYYNPMRGKKLSETLVEVKKHADEIGLPIQYYNIDSWWYRKSVSALKRRLIGGFGRIVGGGLYGGALVYERDPDQMHVPVDELSRLLGKPLVAHHRWFHADTPYRRQYAFHVEKNRFGFWKRLIHGYDDKAICLEPGLWDRLMADCRRWNIAVWVQDWLELQFRSFPMLRGRTGNADRWLLNMAEAAAGHEVTMQYTLSTPGINLTSLKLDAVSYVRTAQDYHPRWPRSYDFKPFAQANILAYALRLWPFKDVFRSTCEGLVRGEKMPEFMALASTLSCGPVGVGDRIGRFGKDTILRACRQDGLILKPDRPLTAADSMFLPNAKYFLCTTHSEIGGRRWEYVLISRLTIRQPRDKTVTKRDIGIADDRVAYDYFGKTFHLLTEDNPFCDSLPRRGYRYWIAAPVLQEGFAVIGDASRYVTMSFREFLSLEVRGNQVSIRVENIAGETVRLLMYDRERIQSIAVDGEEAEKREGALGLAAGSPQEQGAWFFDRKAEASLLLIRFGRDGTKEISIELGQNSGRA